MKNYLVFQYTKTREGKEGKVIHRYDNVSKPFIKGFVEGLEKQRKTDSIQVDEI